MPFDYRKYEKMIERLLDNASVASQEKQLLRDDNDNETYLRESVRLNVAEPLVREIEVREVQIESLKKQVEELQAKLDNNRLWR